MPRSKVEPIELVMDLEDCWDEPGADAAPADPEDSWDIEIRVPVVPLAADRFRVVEPISLTPFGPLGPAFSLGDVIATRPLADGTHRYVRTVQAGRVWGWIIQCPRVLDEARAVAERDGSREHKALDRILREGEYGRMLGELEAMDGAWEYVVGNLMVQVPRGRDQGETEPPARVRDLVQRLHAVFTRDEP